MQNEASAAARTGRRAAWACLACTVVVGAVVMLETVGGLATENRPSTLWWVGLALVVPVQLVATGLVPAPGRIPNGWWVAALVALCQLTFLLLPAHGLTAALLVVSAAAVAQHASSRVTTFVIVSQSTVSTAALALLGWQVGDVIAGLLVYTGFQAFGALVVRAARSEAEARDELARVHAELRATVALLESSSRDAERLRIARDLHDVVGHQLTALAIELEVATHTVGKDGREHVQRARALAKGLLQDVRTAVGEMRQGRSALEPTLTAMALGVPGMSVRVRVRGAEWIDADQAHVVLRCAQEAITNALRHAGAGRLDLEVEADADGLLIRASDDGDGVETLVVGHGLTGMRERLEALGGSLCIRSRPGSGFTVEGRLPRAEAAA